MHINYQDNCYAKHVTRQPSHAWRLRLWHNPKNSINQITF